VQGVEGVEKFLLDPLLAGQKLDVVDEQDIGLAVFLAELATSLLFWMASMYSLVNFSEETIGHPRVLFAFRLTCWPMAWSRWVLPRPTPP
jgi:hypothetical protein